MEDKKSWSIAAVVLIVAGALALVLWAQRAPSCGDGTCDDGESFTTCAQDCRARCGDASCDVGEGASDCPADCAKEGAAPTRAPSVADGAAASAPAVPPAAAPADVVVPSAAVPGAAGSDRGLAPLDRPAPGAPTAPEAGGADRRAADPVAPSTSPRCGDGRCEGAETGATCPSDCQPVGRCRDAAFRKIVAQVVKECAAGCTFDSKNPVVSVSEDQFRSLFAHGADTGIGVYFAIFGCNVWKRDRSDCWGYDAHYAEAAQCPPDPSYECATRSEGAVCDPAGAQARCKCYAGAIEQSVREFLTRWHTAPHMLLLGTSSRTGNQRAPSGAWEMAPKNRDLALSRAGNVEGLIDRLRGEFDTIKRPIVGKSYKVVLDNTKQFFDSPGFQRLVASQMRVDRTAACFRPTTANALNRSVMLIAVQCDLSAELAAIGAPR